jgi:hypothetical protein
MPSSAQCRSGRNGYSVTIPQVHSAFRCRRIIFRPYAPHRIITRCTSECRNAIPRGRVPSKEPVIVEPSQAECSLFRESADQANAREIAHGQPPARRQPPVGPRAAARVAPPGPPPARPLAHCPRASRTGTPRARAPRAWPGAPMTSRVPSSVSADGSPGAPQASAETPPYGRLTPQVSGEMDQADSQADPVAEEPTCEQTTCRSGRRSARSASEQDLRTWAGAVAATLPPLTGSQVAAVARIAARLDASDESKGPAALGPRVTGTVPTSLA